MVLILEEHSEVEPPLWIYFMICVMFLSFQVLE